MARLKSTLERSSRNKLATDPKCVCGHPASWHSHPPDFGCPEEKNGCGCVGLTLPSEKTASTLPSAHVKTVAYHGTPKGDISEFNSTKWRGIAGYFTTDPEFGKMCAEEGTLYEVELTINKAADFRSYGSNRFALQPFIQKIGADQKLEKSIAQSHPLAVENPQPIWSYLAMPVFLDYLKKLGFEGVVYEEHDTECFVAFSPSQVKIVGKVKTACVSCECGDCLTHSKAAASPAPPPAAAKLEAIHVDHNDKQIVATYGREGSLKAYRIVGGAGSGVQGQVGYNVGTPRVNDPKIEKGLYEAVIVEAFKAKADYLIFSNPNEPMKLALQRCAARFNVEYKPNTKEYIVRFKSGKTAAGPVRDRQIKLADIEFLFVGDKRKFVAHAYIDGHSIGKLTCYGTKREQTRGCRLKKASVHPHWSALGVSKMLTVVAAKHAQTLGLYTVYSDSGAKIAAPFQVDSPQFKAWFNGSKVVNKDGSPMRVFHGTKASEDFYEFSVDGPVYNEAEDAPSSSGSGADPTAYMGAHFAQEPETANQFAGGKGWMRGRYDGPEEKPRVMALYLSIRNPKVFNREQDLHEFIAEGTISDDHALEVCMESDDVEPDSPEADEWYEKYHDDQDFRVLQHEYIFSSSFLGRGGVEEQQIDAAQELGAEARARLEKAGYDGIRYANMVEGGTSWIIFDPSQAKSAWGNSGEYSRENKSIMASEWKLTDTPEFKAWFAGSKITTPGGKPLRVFHGTKADFDTFEQREGTVSTIFGSAKVPRNGFFFTPDPNIASDFTLSGDTSRGAHVMPCYLSIKEPANFFKGEEVIHRLVEEAGWRYQFFNSRPAWEWFDEESGAALIEALKKLGYDGAIIPEEGHDSPTYIAFDPRQIKSAVSSKFSPDKTSITAAQDFSIMLKPVEEAMKPFIKQDTDKLLNDLQAEPGQETQETQETKPEDKKRAEDLRKIADYFASLEPKIKEEVAWAQRVLKKSNWVTWYLAYYRSAVLSKILNLPAVQQNPDIHKIFGRMARKYRDEILKRNGNDEWSLESFKTNPHQLKEELAHYRGTPYIKIQNYDPTGKTIQQVLRDMFNLDREFAESRKGTISPKTEAGDRIFIDFKDGWAWWLLPRASCEDEANAMGHCGNSPDKDKTTMSILSLRKKKKVIGAVDEADANRWEPHLTFILHRLKGEDSGTLGEMKGKGNAKPAPRYHPYIIALLEDPRIKGIDGGGYKPENNFSPEDLSPEEREAIEEKNPGATLTMKEYFDNYGFDGTLEDRVMAAGGFKGQTYDGYIIKTWPSVKDYMDEIGGRQEKELAACMEDQDCTFLRDKIDESWDEYEGDFSDERERDLFLRTMKDLIMQGTTDSGVAPETDPEEIFTAWVGGTFIKDSPIYKLLEEGYVYSLSTRKNPTSGEEIDDLNDLLGSYLDSASYESEGDGHLEHWQSGLALTIDTYAIENDIRDGEDFTRTVDNISVPSGHVDFGYDKGAFMDYVASHSNYKNYTNKVKEDAGQTRLFPEPKSDEEAAQQGMHVSKLLRKNAVPSPKQIQELMKTYGLTEDQINQAVEADPTKGSYVRWICKRFNPVDLPSIAEALANIDKLKRSSRLTGSRDINSYDLKALEALPKLEPKVPKVEGHTAIISYAKIDDRWREMRVGLGQKLYDELVQALKKRGYKALESGSTKGYEREQEYHHGRLSPDAQNAWKRLSLKYPIKWNEEGEFYVLDLTKAEPFVNPNMDPRLSEVKFKVVDNGNGVSVLAFYRGTQIGLISASSAEEMYGDRPGSPYAKAAADLSGLLHPDAKLLRKNAVTLSPNAKNYLNMSGGKVVDEADVGDYELFVVKEPMVPGLFNLGIQRKGMDAFDIEQNGEDRAQQSKTFGAGNLNDITDTLDKWIAKYKKLSIFSYSERKTQFYMALLKRFGYSIAMGNIMGMEIPFVYGHSKTKRAALFPKAAILSVIIDDIHLHKVTLMLDLGIAACPQFTVSLPLEESMKEDDILVRKAFLTLIDTVSAYLISLGFAEDDIVDVTLMAEQCFTSLAAADASDAGMGDQDGLRIYEKGFKIPDTFHDEVMKKVITASKVKRSPSVREEELNTAADPVQTVDYDQMLEGIRDQAVLSTPRPMTTDFVTTKTNELGKVYQWKSKLFQLT